MSKDILSSKANVVFIERCPVGCKSSMVPTDIVLPEGPLLKCVECGQLVSQCTEDVFVSSMQGFNTARGTFPDEKDGARANRLHYKRLRMIVKVLGLLPQQISLLDVGCSSGAFLASAKALGFKETGVEPAIEAAKTAMRMGLNVTHGFLEDLDFPDKYFDAITMFEVIEHIEDPLRLLKECCRILKVGGLVVIGTGNTDSWTVSFLKGRWSYFSMTHGGHISFYNPNSMTRLAERAGFEVLKIKTRRVSISNKDHASQLQYRLSRVIEEMLSLPAKLFGKGHDALFFLKKR